MRVVNRAYLRRGGHWPSVATRSIALFLRTRNARPYYVILSKTLHNNWIKVFEFNSGVSLCVVKF